MRSDARKRLNPAPHHDPAVVEIIARACADAWDQGYQTCCGDFDIAARREARSLNPYRAIQGGAS